MMDRMNTETSKRESQCSSELKQLAEALNVLADRINSLETQLAPVLSIDPNAETPCMPIPTKDPVQLVPLAEQIRMHRHTVERLFRAVGDICHRMEC